MVPRMAAAVPGGAAPAAANAIATFRHPGDPDLAVAANVAALGDDPRVLLVDASYALQKATPEAGWVAAPVDAATGVSPGWFLSQSTLDMWAVAAGRVTTFLRSRPSILSLHVRPVFFSGMMDALVHLGRLSLGHTHKNGEWLVELERAGAECGSDPRVMLVDTTFFNVQARATGAATVVAHDFMYIIGGDLMFTEDDCDTFAAAYMLKVTAPRNLRAGRDAARDPYCRFFATLRSVTSSRSEYFREVLADPNTPADEVAEYVVSTWMLLVKTGYPFAFGPRFSQRGMEIEMASKMAFGTVEQKEIAFTELFPDRLNSLERVRKCVESGGKSQDWGKSIETFAHLAELFFPSSVWANFTMVSAVEHELAKITHVVESWGRCRWW